MKKGITIMIGITGIVLLTAAVIIGAKVFPLSETNNDVQSNISPAKTRADNDTIAQVDGEELTEQEFRGVLLTEIGLGEENMSIDTALFHFARARVATNELKKWAKKMQRKTGGTICPSWKNSSKKIMIYQCDSANTTE